MNFNIFKSKEEKSTIVLGEFVVEERGKLRESIELESDETISNNNELMHWGKSFLDIPSKSDYSELPNGAIELNFRVNFYSQGSFSGVDPYVPFMFWRPKVSVTLVAIKSKAQKKLFNKTVTKKMSFSQAQSKMITLKSLFGFKSAFSKDDVFNLLGESVLELLGMLRAKL